MFCIQEKSMKKVLTTVLLFCMSFLLELGQLSTVSAKSTLPLSDFEKKSGLKSIKTLDAKSTIQKGKVKFGDRNIFSSYLYYYFDKNNNLHMINSTYTGIRDVIILGKNKGKEKKISIAQDKIGGFYREENGTMYVVAGKNNYEENVKDVVLWVYKYDANWKVKGVLKVKSDGLNQNSKLKEPFAYANCRIAKFKNYLVVHTGGKIFRHVDGINHQRNFTLIVDTNNMTNVTKNYSLPFVSHSFNQFVKIDQDGNVYYLDHGDGTPRALRISKFGKYKGFATKVFEEYNSYKKEYEEYRRQHGIRKALLNILVQCFYNREMYKANPENDFLYEEEGQWKKDIQKYLNDNSPKSEHHIYQKEIEDWYQVGLSQGTKGLYKQRTQLDGEAIEKSIEKSNVDLNIHNQSLVHDILEFKGEAGDNYTGCQVFGFEKVGDTLVTYGAAVPSYMEKPATRKGKEYNCFVILSDTNLKKSKIIWLTEDVHHATGSGGKLVKLNENRFAVLYEMSRGDVPYLCYREIDTTGKLKKAVNYKNAGVCAGSETIWKDGNLYFADLYHLSDGVYLYKIPVKKK